MGNADIGLIGLAVMGENLVINMESKGFCVAVYNRTTSRVRDFTEGRAKGKSIFGAYSLQELVGHLKRPRKVMLMVKAGKPVDDFIELLIPLLEQGDIIIDGGNSHFMDTARRSEYVNSKGLLYVGCGVSGGEEGALMGPSLMPGGSIHAWEHIKPIFQAICAKAEGQPCCEWVGQGGAGHFVKMVHNGIEYGDMQLIGEAYHILREYVGLTPRTLHKVFRKWNDSELNSYLIEITSDILRHVDEDGAPLVDKILDTAGQKGTGKWTAVTALDEGVNLSLIAEAVFARCLSAIKDERVQASQLLKGPKPDFKGDAKEFTEDVKKALYASKIVSYAQGFALLKAAASTYGWDLNYGDIALMWRGGCIIRSVFLGEIKNAFDNDSSLANLLLHEYFKKAIDSSQKAWRRVCAKAIKKGIPMPAMAAALSYYDGYRSARMPANLLQAQRDYFGAHTYERVDRERGEFFHTNWTGTGGNTSATAYSV